MEDDILRASENRMAHHWSLDAAKAGLTNAYANEVQAGGIREGWWPLEDQEEAGLSTVWLSLSSSRFLGGGSALWHLIVGIWLMVSFFQLYSVSNAYLQSQS